MEELSEEINISRNIDTSGDPDAFLASASKQGELVRDVIETLFKDPELYNSNHFIEITSLVDEFKIYPEALSDTAKHKRLLELAREVESTREIMKELDALTHAVKRKGSASAQMSEEAKAADKKLTQASTNPSAYTTAEVDKESPTRELSMNTNNDAMNDLRAHDGAAKRTGNTNNQDAKITNPLEHEILEINQRIEEFSKTHGAVLLGMHRELSSLKLDVTTQLRTSTQAIDKMANQMQGDQLEVLDFVKNSLSEAIEKVNAQFNSIDQTHKQLVENIYRKSELLMAALRTESSDTLGQAKKFLNQIESSAIDFLGRIDNQAKIQNDNLIAIKTDFASRTQKLLDKSQNTLNLSKNELDDKHAKIVAYMSVQQRLLDEHSEDLKMQQKALIDQQADLNKKVAEHHQKVEQFNSTIRKLSIASLALLTGFILWYGANQWLH